MNNTSKSLLEKAAHAAKQTPEEFARSVRGILCPRGCRDTRAPRRRIFTPEVMRAINCA